MPDVKVRFSTEGSGNVDGTVKSLTDAVNKLSSVIESTSQDSSRLTQSFEMMSGSLTNIETSIGYVNENLKLTTNTINTLATATNLINSSNFDIISESLTQDLNEVNDSVLLLNENLGRLRESQELQVSFANFDEATQNLLILRKLAQETREEIEELNNLALQNAGDDNTISDDFITVDCVTRSRSRSNRRNSKVFK